LNRVTLIDAQIAGISGDMLLGALIDAGAKLDDIQRTLNMIPDHFARCSSIKLNSTEVKKHGFRSCRAHLTITEQKRETKASELILATQEIVASAKVSDKARTFANKAMKILTDVESKLHGADPSSTHLHEAGSADTLADILGAATACDSLGLFEGEIYSCPVAVGGGTVTFSHGTVSVPAPAVLEIARQHHVPIFGGPSDGELTTPTGVSILAALVDTFVEAPPLLIPDIVGYGAGSRELSGAPNVLRLVVGRKLEDEFDRDRVQVVETNLDDVSGEVVGLSVQRILEAGAKDAWVTAAQFKKGRPGYVLHAICSPEDLEKISRVMITQTGTLGVRYQPWNRFILQREFITIKMDLKQTTFDVRLKVARNRFGEVARIKPEFEDLDSISRATSLPARVVSDLVLEKAKKDLGKKTGEPEA